MNSKTLSTFLMSTILWATGAMADDKTKNNPFGLVYKGAITENKKGKVNIHPTTYKLNGLDISANVYTPANYSSTKKYPAVVIAHPNGGVKEQVAGLYAQHLAELGYIAITADAAYQGASGGQPRNPQIELKIFMAWLILLHSIQVLMPVVWVCSEFVAAEDIH